MTVPSEPWDPLRSTTISRRLRSSPSRAACASSALVAVAGQRAPTTVKAFVGQGSRGCLVVQESLFGVDAAAVRADEAVRAAHPVAGHHEGQRVVGARGADGAHRSRVANGSGDGAIAC